MKEILALLMTLITLVVAMPITVGATVEITTGDANCDGVGGKKDVQNFCEHLIGAKNVALADVNNDGKQ